MNAFKYEYEEESYRDKAIKDMQKKKKKKVDRIYENYFVYKNKNVI